MINRANGLIEQDPLAHILRYLTNIFVEDLSGFLRFESSEIFPFGLNY